MSDEVELVKRERAKRASSAANRGCLRSLARVGFVLFLIIALPILILHTLFSPLQQLLIDHLHQVINFSIPTEKESDMIAITCGHDVYTVEADGDNLRRIRRGSLYRRFQDISWSPDGEWLALALTEPLTWHNDSLYKLRFDGSRSQRLTFDRWDKRLAVWTPDGAAIRYLTDRDVWQISTDGGAPTRLDLDGFRLYSTTNAAWSPTGDALIVERGKYEVPADSVGYLYMLAPGPGGLVWEQPLKESLDWLDIYGASIDRIRWSPTGDRIAYRTHQEGYIHRGDAPADGYRLRTEIRILDLASKEETTVYQRFGYDDFRWSPDGQWLAIIDYGGLDSDNQRHLLILDTYTGEISDIASGEIHRTVNWSPDSEWIAFAYETGDEAGMRTDKSQVVKIRRDGADMQPIAELDCEVHRLSWSPR